MLSNFLWTLLFSRCAIACAAIYNRDTERVRSQLILSAQYFEYAEKQHFLRTAVFMTLDFY